MNYYNIHITDMKRYTLDEILHIVASATKTTIDAIRSRSKNGELVEARQIYCAIAYDYKYGYSEIGRLICRTHANVIYSIRTIRDVKVLNKKYKHILSHNFNQVAMKK